LVDKSIIINYISIRFDRYRIDNPNLDKYGSGNKKKQEEILLLSQYKNQRRLRWKKNRRLEKLPTSRVAGSNTRWLLTGLPFRTSLHEQDVLYLWYPMFFGVVRIPRKSKMRS
jgi:hypothetical protein